MLRFDTLREDCRRGGGSIELKPDRRTSSTGVSEKLPKRLGVDEHVRPLLATWPKWPNRKGGSCVSEELGLSGMPYAEPTFVRVSAGRVTGLRARLSNSVSRKIAVPTESLTLNLLGQFQKGRSRCGRRWIVAETWRQIIGAYQIAITRSRFRRWRWQCNLRYKVWDLMR